MSASWIMPNLFWCCCRSKPKEKDLYSPEAMLDMITEMQSERMDSQRAELRPIKKPAKEAKGVSLPGLRARPLVTAARAARAAQSRPEDEFLEMLARVQGTRFEDQRSELPRPKPELWSQERARTVPDDDFFAQLMRAQAGRMEDQRATIPLQENRQNKAGPAGKK